jgi:gliding motility-associated-like protein
MRKLFLASIIGLLSVVASAQNWTGSNKTINSGDLRFGDGSELSINYTGNVQQPFYKSGGSWYQLTYSNYPLDYEIASGGNGSSSFNRNGTIEENPIMTNQVFDHSGFIITSGSTGYGTLKVKGNITVGSDLLEVTFSYYIANPNDNFCKITTSIKNIGSATATNLRYWVGTRDDYVGVFDSNTKTKGNIVNGVFTQIPTAATQSKALRISNGSDAVLFYTTSPLANMSHASCCSFSNSSGIDPTSSAITASGDGSYAMFIRLPDLGVGQTQTFDWFYAAGSMSEIAQIAAQVASASIGVNNITTNSANLAAFSSNAGTGYYLVVPAGSPAPTAAEIIAGGNYGSVTIETSGSGPLTANTTNNLSMPGLSPLTNYTVYFVSQYMSGSVLTNGAIANQDFTTLFSCGEIFTRQDGSAQATQCPGVSGTPVNSSVIGTAYVNAPTSVKTSSIRYKWSAATFPTIVPVISSVWVNGISSAMQVGPPSVSITAGGEYFVDYCFYNVNLPVTGTYSLRFINPLTGNEVGYCTYNANDNGPTVTPVLVPNVLPTVSSISNISLPCAASATSPVNFTVSDLETAAGQLIVSATSSNTNLIPNANLVITQPNASGAASLTYTVASGQVGSATITVSALDHLGGIGTRTFTVTVSSATPISINNSLCGSNGLQWMNMTNISAATASGVGQNGITVAITQSGSGMLNVNGMYQGNQFPGIYNVPTTGATIANQFAGNFQACFSQPVVNPVVAFSSIGNPSNCVPIVISQPYSVVWTGQNMTYTSSTQMTGCEGKTIIRLDGTVTCVNFNYLASEYYCTVAFGFENQNCYTPTICSGNSVTLTAGLSSNYVWTPSTGLNTTTGPVVVANPTTTTTYTVSSSTDLCSSPTQVTVVVNQTPSLTNTVSNSTVCRSTIIPAQAFTSNVAGTIFNWTNSNPAIGLAGSGTGSVPSFTAQNNTSAPITATITVTPITSSLCSGTPVTYTITVNPTPTVAAVTNQALCAGLQTAAVNFAGTVAGTAFNWTNTNSAIGLALSGVGNIGAFTATNTSASNISGSLTVTPSANGCTGTAQFFSITVIPVPNVVVPSNQVYNLNETVPAQVFTGNLSGTVYNWTNSNTAIGIPAIGNGNINSFTALNSTSSPITSTITVTPTKQFSYTVYRTHNGNGNTSQYPDFVMNATMFDNLFNVANSNTTVWSNGVTSPSILLNWNGYTNLNAAGISTPPNGDYFGVKIVGSFTAAESGVYTFELQGDDAVDLLLDGAVAVSHYGGHGMTSNIGTFTMVAGQTYALVARHQEYGGGEGFILRWKRPSQSTFAIQPEELAGCDGPSQSYTITVDPIPNVNLPSNVINCEGTLTTVDFNGTTSNTNYLWTNSNTGIGLAASGSNDLSFTSQNLTNVPQTSTVVVTPQMYVTQGYVWGSINENGSLILNAPAGKVFTTVDFASYGTPGGSAGNYTLGACHAATSSSVISALAIGNSSMTVVANNATFGDPCSTLGKALAVKLGYGVSVTGIPQTFTITVNPSASISNSSDTICTGTAFNFVPSPSDIIPANTSYSWTVVDNTNITGETNQVTPTSSVSQVLFNGSSLDQNVTYTVTPISGSGGCIGAPFTYNVTVTPLPTTITALGATSFCDGGSVTLTAPVAPLQMSYTYQWNLNGAPIAGATSITYNATQSGSFTVTVTNNAGCSAISQAIVVTEHPLPTVAAVTGNTDICVGASTTLASTTIGGVWASSNTATATVNSATGVVTGVSAGSVNVSYTVTDANGCTSKQSALVNVIAFPTVAAITGASSVCVGSNVSYVNATSGGVWSSSNTSVASVSANGTVSGVSPGQATITYAVTNATGCVTSVLAAITVNALPTPSITASGPVTFCTSGTVTLTASAGSSYLWSNGAQTQSITVSTSGSYYVTTTNALGCAGTSASTVVTMNANPTVNILAAGPTAFCQGGSVILNASPSTAGNTYLWSTGATTSSINATATANITVTVTTAAGCSSTSLPTSVLVNPNPTATITANGPITFCQGGSVTLAANIGSGFTYQWSNNTNSQVNTINTAGSYTVTVTDANGCSTVSAPTVVTVNPLPATPAITGTAAVCIGGTTLLSTTAPSPVWSSANASIATIAANGLVSGVAAGTTQVSYTTTNANGCTNTGTTTVTVNPLPTAAISAVGATTFCQGGSVTFLASTAPAGLTYTYQWNLNGTAITGANANSYVANASGNYTVTITTNHGCSATSTATLVNVLPLPTLAANTGATSVCENATTSLGNAQTGGLWSTANNTIAVINAISGQVTGVNPGSTTLTYTFTNANGCTNSVSTNFTVNALPSAIITASGSTSICQGSSVVLTASPGSSYLWSTGATTPSITVNNAQDVSVTVTNANGCSATSTITSVVVNPLPVANISSLNGNSFCQGSSVTLVASSGSSYLWSNGAFTQSINVTSSETLTVTVTNAFGCSTTSAPFSTTMIPAPSTTITASGSTTFCAGGSVTLSAPTAAAYLWSSGETTQSIVATVDGPYTVTVTNGSGCIAISPNTIVTVYALPIVQAIAGSNNVCVGSNVILSNATLGGVWTSVNPAIATISSTGEVTGVSQGIDTLIYTVTNANGCSSSVSFTILVNGVSTLTSVNGVANVCTGSTTTLSNAQIGGVWSSSDVGVATIAANGVVNGLTAGSATITYSYTNPLGCTSTTNQTLVVYPLPNANVSANGPTTFCSGGMVTLSAPSGLSYAWSTGAPNQSIDVTSSGSYNVIVTDLNGCTSTSTPISVTVNALPPVAIAPIGATTFCVGGSVTLISPLNSTYLYAWNEGSSPIVGALNNTLIVSTTGNFSLTITDANGCVATSAALPVVVNALPSVTATAGSPTSFCDGGSVTLTASGATSYVWSNGLTSPSITVSTSDAYFVVGTSSAGCSSSSNTISVVVNPLPVPTITSSGSSVCLGSTVTLTANGGATYSWSNGSTNATIAVTAANVYTVTATSAEGCIATASETVVFNANPSVTISANGPTVFCQGGSLTLTATGGSNYVWNNGTLGATATVNQSGSYYVVVTNAAGCTTQSSLVNVAVNSVPVVAAITGANTVCEGGNILLSSASIGGTWSVANNFIANIDGAGNVTGLNAGSTTVSYTVSNNGCTATATAQLNVLNNPVTPTITSSGATAVCPGSTVVLFASNGANYQWNTGATTPFVVATQSGAYTVTVTGINGCSATSLPMNVSIGDNTNPVITAPLNVTVTPNLGCEAIGVTLGSPITSDNCGVATVSNDAPAIYPIGTTTVTWTVTDASGNISTATQLVTVVDQTAPSAFAPANVTVASNSNCEATNVELGLPNATDNCTNNLVVTNNAPTTYPLGNTIVTWTITDAAGNITTVDQTVTVVDQTEPVVLLANTTLILDANGYATIDFTDLDNGSYDNCGIASIELSQSAFDCSQVGKNFITVYVTDNSGNQAYAVVMVTVIASDACGGDNWAGPSVPDAFTPNGNNYNDTWVIPGLEGYNTKEMAVYSRYGTLVHYSSVYNNDWDGTLLNSGSQVPDGTYYYILNLDGGKQLNGYVYINRVKQ